MCLQDWETTIQTITDECRGDPNGVNMILLGWRAKLEREPYLLEAFQIDEIVREVRQRLIHGS